MDDLKDKIAGLSPAKRALLERMRKQAASSSAAPSIRARASRNDAPLSFAQQRLWLIQQLDPESCLYNVPRAVRIRGKLKLPALQQALNEVVRRHEILRTTFVADGDQPVQRVSPSLPIALPLTDLSELSKDRVDKEIQRVAAEEIRQPFDLAHGPLLRARLFRLAPEDHVLVFAMHHIASDGWTAGILFDELGALYQSFAKGLPSTLPEQPIQYADYSVWQREWMDGKVLEDELDYWRGQLAGAPPSLDLPTDHPRPEDSRHRGTTKSIVLTKLVSENLKTFSQSHGVTVFTTLLAALKILLSRWSGQDDLVVGTVSANRNRTEIERLIGCFMNFLPLRDQVLGSESAKNLLAKVNKTILDAYAHQDCPFEKMIEALNPERALNVNPLYNVALLMQNFPEIAFGGDAVEARFLTIDTEVAFLDLRFIATETAEGLQLGCEYNVDLFDSATIEAVLESYQMVIEQLLAHSETSVSEFQVSAALATQAETARKRDKKQTIAVVATFTAEPVEEAIAFWMRQFGTSSRIEFAPYNQVFQQLLDPSSLLARNTDGINAVLIRVEDWVRFEKDGSNLAGHREKIERSARELVAGLKAATQRSAVPHLVCICPLSATLQKDAVSSAICNDVETLLAADLEEVPGVHVITSAALLDLYPVSDYSDDYADQLGHIPYTSELFAALGTMIARRIAGIRNAPFKVIALDCDNTLWKGVCGEDGPLGIQVDAPHLALQEFMIAQQRAGMVLCLCSKNVEEDVTAVFEQNPGMRLKRGDIVASRINWHSKSQNLKDLARELGLGLDSFVFIDDNPLECAEVQANCPEVLVLQLPEREEQIPQFLKHIWALDHWKITGEDRKRAEMYRQSVEREQLRKEATSLEDFLAGLELQVDIRPMQPNELARVSQLTERTNQFNFTTLRRSEAEIQKLCDSGSECLIVNLKDRFGDYGLVGVVLFSESSEALQVDTFLLSCRALGRKVEHRMLAFLGERAQKAGLGCVDLHFSPTKKNQPALDFLDAVGFQFKTPRDGGFLYRLPAQYAANAEQLSASATVATEKSSPSPVANRQPNQSRILARIAAEWNNVAAITHAIESQKTLRSQAQTLFVPPRNPTEEIVAGIWARLLHADRVGVHENFFALGGHSLLATQAIARIRQALGVELPLRAMFEAPTVASLSKQITFARRSTDTILTPALTSVSREQALPLSFGQQRLWFLDQLEPGNPLYNIPQVMRLSGSLNVDALQRSLDEIARRHEVLRTTFASDGGEPIQVIAPHLQLPVRRIDLREVALDQREAEVERRVRQEAVRPFNLQAGPLMRVHLWQLDDQEHFLLLNMHHAVSDRWSMGILAEELAALYAAFTQDKPSPLAELAIQYADFAVWQREWLQGESLKRSLDYWKNRLSGAPPVLELPTDRPRPAVQTYRGASTTHLLPRELVTRLGALSQSEGVTLFMNLLAAFQALLARYSRQEDIVVGSPIANRNYAEVEPLIGFFVNTLALRSDLSGDPTFRELLQRVRGVALGAYAHQDVPFEKLVEELHPERSLSHNPIFQTLFALQNAPMQALELPGLHLERVPLYTGTSMFDMSWFAIEVPEGLLFRAEYSTDLFDVATINRMLRQFEIVLQGVVEHPEHRLSELPLLDEKDRAQVVVEFNRTEADYPKDLCIHNFFEAQSARTPDAVALIHDQQRLTYAALNARANQLAHYLRTLGVGPDVLVGICTERSIDMMVGILGILKAGGAYVPLDPAYPKDRLACILEDAKAPILLTQQALVPGLPAHSSRTISLDAEWPAIARESTTNLASAVKPENLAYVLFTSGSTGRPKGVALEHRSAATFLHWAQSVFTPAELAGILLSTSMCFDLSVFEMFVPLSVGGAIILAQNALYLPTLPAKDDVTLINTVPSAIAELVRMKGIPDSVKVVNLAGEALPDALVEQIYASTAVEKVYNLYGPTEDTTYSTYTLVPRGEAVTIGRPLANTQAYILDTHRQPLPVGVPGELYLAGEGLARGYFGRPDLTEERFVHNPFSAKRHARMYRTGDLCRWLPDSNIEYLGRMDHQVKLRGFRIELGEIESALAKHPAVHHSVVMVREDEPGLKRLVAYVACQANPIKSEDLAAHLRQSLPEFMVPSVFVFLDALPLTPNGKVNRSALPVPEYQRDEENAFTAPRTSAEERIAAIWAEVLRLPRVSIHDDFFALGGHSLLATQIISRIRQTLAVELPLRALFESPTVAGLAARIGQLQPASGTSEQIPGVSRDQHLPLSFAQQRLWFLDQLEPNNPLYNIPWALAVNGELDVAALEQSLNAIVERHETLRTTFAAENDEPTQRIATHVRLSLPVVDFSQRREPNRQAEVEAVIREEAQRPFDLKNGPLFRATLLRLGTQEHVLLLNIHHIISDRWSMGVLSHELAALYGATIEGKPSPLPQLPVQYADFTVWQRQWLESGVLEEQLAYWKDQLKDAPPVLELPTDRPRSAVASFRGAVRTIHISRKTTERLNLLCREQGATLFMALFAGFQALLARYSGQEDIVVGTPIANRNRAEIEGLIGFFANTLVLRTKIQGEMNFSDLLAQVKDAALGAYAHQDIPFEKLVEELRPGRSLSHNPLVQVFFALQNVPLDTLQLRGLKLTPIETNTETAKGDLFFSLVETADGLRGRMEYNTDLYDEATIARMLEHYQVLLEAAVATPAVPVMDLPLLTRGERQQLLGDWNATDFDYPRQLCLHEVFEQQVGRAPNAIACQFENQTWSYQELNQRANQIAHFLKQRGVGPGQRVGLFVERSLMMMAGLLGIQKSGAAYVPLDPSYPVERLRLTLDDAQVPVLLTQQSLLASMPEHQAEVVCLDADWEKIGSHSTANPKSGAKPEDLVYVIFTSGSTGRPKGVQVPHRAVVNLLSFMAAELRMGPQDVFPALASFAFDMCIPELYLALVSGGRVIVGDRHLAANGEALAELLRATGATIVHATPTTWNLLLEAGFTGQGLKRVIGAEALPRELCARLLEADPSLYNFYGPTETTVWSAFHHFRSPDEAIVVGRPLANTQIYILDAHGQPVPVGVPGEIHIAGDGVTCGYLKRPELTAEKFIADPFSSKPNQKMYRTGDLGRFLLDGRIEFQGRIDNQVKVRGYRIELGEIEAVLGQHPSVQECAVIAREDVEGDKRLVGYVVPTPGQTPNAAELRAWVKERVPEYMTPVAFVTLDRFPLSPNGKVDRKHLPAPDYVRPELGRAYLGARTPAEEVIAGIWAEVLKLDQVGIEDDFFELGGHSLLATQVVSRIRQAFQVELPLRAMFEAPTVAGLAERTEALQRQKQGLTAPAMTRVARDQALPLSFAQQRLWFLDQLEPNNPLYNVPHIVRLRGPLNPAVLEKTLNEIVRRHETLRTRFESIDDQPVQVIAPTLTLPLAISDLSAIAETDRETEARKRAMEAVKQPFDLATGPLLRASLLKLSDDDHVLILNTHHIISDRWSLGVLSQELAAIYEAFLADRPSPLAELAIQYADYAVWQRQYLSGATLDQQLQYWKHQLHDAPPTLDLPTDRPRQAVENFWGGVYKQILPEELVKDLRALSRRQSATFFMTLLAAFQTLLARWSGQNDVVVGTDLANRTQVETEKLIGFFVNLLPIRTRFAGNPSFEETLKQVREGSLGAFAHQDLPFDKLVEELRPERSLTHNPVVQVLFVMQNTPQMAKEFGGLTLGPLGVSSTSRFDLVLFINDPDGTPYATWMYNPNLFEASTIERIASLYQALLRSVAADPGLRMAAIRDLLGEAEKQHRTLEEKAFQEASLQKLKRLKRKAMSEA